MKEMLKDKNYHVITTNADNAFYAAEYDMDKVFRIQGSMDCGNVRSIVTSRRIKMKI